MAKTDRTAILRLASEPASYNANVDWAIPEKKKKKTETGVVGYWGYGISRGIKEICGISRA